MKRRATVLSTWGIIIVTIGLLLFGTWLIVNSLSKPQATVTIGGLVVKADLARTDAELTRGLGGVSDLPDGRGMLFVFPGDGPQRMWMKDMRINLDMVWLSSTKAVVHIEHDLSPSTYPHAYQSSVPARYVLELPAGAVADAGIMIGTTASFDLP